MITLTKLRTLGRKTLLRKAALLLFQIEKDALAGASVDTGYLKELTILIQEKTNDNDVVAAACEVLLHQVRADNEGIDVARGVNTLRHVLQEYLGVSSGDWDFYDPQQKRLDGSRRNVLPLRVYLDDIRSPFNVGSIFRTADSFGVEKIVVSPFSASPLHPRSIRTSMGCTESVCWEKQTTACLEAEPNVFALELGGVSIDEFMFPQKGTVIIGSEELGISPEALAVADRGLGRVSVPLYGTKGSLNVSVAFGILMYTWRRYLKDST